VLVSFVLPRLNEHMTTAEALEIHASVGDALGVGSRLLDLKLDLSAAAAHDCPPISYFRVSLREPVWLRALNVGETSAIEPGKTVALFTTTPDEPLEGEAARSARVTIAGLIVESAWREG
jgi:hypothetical protein